MIRTASISCILVLSLAAVMAHAAPAIGDKAPPIKIAQWMNAMPKVLPGDKDAGKHAFLIEFWATWCGPCWQSIPHLAELHRKHEGDGLIVIAVSNEEPETIAKFMNAEKNGKKRDMPYYVGADADMATTTAWTSKIPTIPHAFIVNQGGVVVWQGNPLDTGSMDPVIEKVLAGKFDIAEAKQAAAKDKEFQELMTKLRSTYAARDAEKLFQLLDRMIELKPQELQPYLIKREMLAEFDRKGEIPKWNDAIQEAFKDSPEGLLSIVMMELDRDAADRNAAMLIHCTARAIDITKEHDAPTLALLARVQVETGQLDAAIETLKLAVEKANEDQRDYYRHMLEYYERLKTLAPEVRSLPKKK
jgi:thiol-disulfide isomerase/thioredoxin